MTSSSTSFEIDVQIMDMPDSLDDTQILAHPFVPAGITFGQLKGTPSYDSGADIYAAFAATVDDCDEEGKTKMATYDWQSGDTSVSQIHLNQFI